MKQEEENMMAVAAFVLRLLQVRDNRKEIQKEFCECICRLKRLMRQQADDEQFFIESVLRRSNLVWLAMDGMKNRSNYVTFRNAVKERPVLMLVKSTTLQIFRGRGVRSEEEQEYAFLWVEYVTGGTYFLHIGGETRAIGETGLLWIYRREKHDFHSRYYVCAQIRVPEEKAVKRMGNVRDEDDQKDIAGERDGL